MKTLELKFLRFIGPEIVIPNDKKLIEELKIIRERAFSTAKNFLKAWRYSDDD